MKGLPALQTSLLLVGVAACSPTLDWRETAAEGSGVVAMFPCHPDRHARTVELAGSKLQMEMLVCPAGGTTYALSFADVADPARVGVALAELRATALANVQAAQPQLTPAQVSGMTPNAEALRVTAVGRLPDGAVVQQRAVFFAKGLRVYQGTMIGAKPALEASEIFFSGFKFPS
jgi:hypothetical protein